MHCKALHLTNSNQPWPLTGCCALLHCTLQEDKPRDDPFSPTFSSDPPMRASVELVAIPDNKPVPPRVLNEMQAMKPPGTPLDIQMQRAAANEVQR